MPGLSFIEEDGEVPPPPLVGGLDQHSAEDHEHLVNGYFPSPPLSLHEGAHPMSEDGDEEDEEDEDDEESNHYHANGELFLSSPSAPSFFEGTAPPSSPSRPAATAHHGGVALLARGLASLPRDSGINATSNLAHFPYPITILDHATDERLRRRNSGRFARDRIVQVPKMVYAASGNCNGGSSGSSISAYAPSTVEGAEGGGPTSIQISSCNEPHHHHHHNHHYHPQHHSLHHHDRTSPLPRRRSLRHRDRRRRVIHSWPLGLGESSSTKDGVEVDVDAEDEEDDDDDGDDHGTRSLRSLHASEEEGAFPESQGEGRPLRRGQARRCVSCVDQPFGRSGHHQGECQCQYQHHHQHNHHHRDCSCAQELTSTNDNNICMPSINSAASADHLAPRPLVPRQLAHQSPPTPNAVHMYDDDDRNNDHTTTIITNNNYDTNYTNNTNNINNISARSDNNDRQARRLLRQSENSQDGERAVLSEMEESCSSAGATFFLGDDIPVQPSWVIEDQQCRLQPPFINNDEQGSTVLSSRSFHHHHHCPEEGTNAHEPPHSYHLPPYVLSSSPRSFSCSLLLRSPYFPQPHAVVRPPSSSSPAAAYCSPSSSTPFTLADNLKEK